MAPLKMFLPFSLFKLFENYNSAGFGKRLSLEDTIVLNTKKAKGHASMKSLSLCVVVSTTTCRVLRSRKTKFWYLMSLVPEIAISLKQDWWLPLNRKDGKRLSTMEACNPKILSTNPRGVPVVFSCFIATQLHWNLNLFNLSKGGL